jgi:hypothetical protein
VSYKLTTNYKPGTTAGLAIGALLVPLGGVLLCVFLYYLPNFLELLL